MMMLRKRSVSLCFLAAQGHHFSNGWVTVPATLPLRAWGRGAASPSPRIGTRSLALAHRPSSLLLNRGGASCLASTSSTGTSTSLLATSTSAFSTSSSSSEAPSSAPKEVFRRDYEPLPFTVDKVHLDLDIREGVTTVTAKLFLQANSKYTGTSNQLVLDGDETSVKLLQVELNDQPLQPGTDFELLPGKLILKNPISGSVLKTIVEIVPEENTQLSGLYKSGSMYCTQCEAMGFRRITYYPDRPDNMATFEQVRLEADKNDYPVLLANGNLMDQGDATTDPSRHYAVWTDPFPKPSYLFCCVAGKLGVIRDTYTTQPSGRPVSLQIFSEPHNVHKLDYAMESLKRSMKWDEDTFGLEYDLDMYNIVAVDDFNMGAMENKGLNVFNTAYVLADQQTATDEDFERVEGVIGHEYFHNWTGNRVTCRDWFQLTLKEGLTVFRDQEFSGDMNSKAVNRIENVRVVRARQFAEDAGPMSHPIRPDSYISMDNFYTSTVYEKGSEVIRMYHTLLGRDGFRKGMDLYFERHDGQAVTCDDFLAAMADANDKDLSQFARWYSTSGTPTVTYSSTFSDGKFTLELSQESRSADPLLIPVSVGLLDKQSGKEVMPTTVLELREKTQVFEFDGLEGDVVPSILRQFSAPVKLLAAGGSENEKNLAFLAANDSDGFNKWEAGQKLYTLGIFQEMKSGLEDTTFEHVLGVFKSLLEDKDSTDFSIIAYGLMLPSETTLAEMVTDEFVDPLAIRKARKSLKERLARECTAELLSRYQQLTDELNQEGEEFKVDAESIGRRRLRNALLDYLCSVRATADEQTSAAQLAISHFENAIGMTDKMGALTALASMDGEARRFREEALAAFYNEANGDPLVLNKWFTVQALADVPDVIENVKKLQSHPDFTLKNPNRCRSLLGAFAMNAAFHEVGGAGYELLGDALQKLDKLNPQISSRLGTSLVQWRKYSPEQGAMMKAQLEKLSSMDNISEDLFEIVSRGLK
eukprot:Nitzschia sp. Nitz4//scaffold32_size149145//97471//100716//NITZ4_002890-RA/size149145-augustus-gene-0.41-mRNA-1//1//CDS//3329548102//7563//frame0